MLPGARIDYLIPDTQEKCEIPSQKLLIPFFGRVIMNIKDCI